MDNEGPPYQSAPTGTGIPSHRTLLNVSLEIFSYLYSCLDYSLLKSLISIIGGYHKFQKKSSNLFPVILHFVVDKWGRLWYNMCIRMGDCSHDRSNGPPLAHQQGGGR